MGEIAERLLNLIGVTALVFAFIANLKVNDFISVTIGAFSLVFIILKCLTARENWLYRRAERREKEHDTKNKIKKK